MTKPPGLLELELYTGRLLAPIPCPKQSSTSLLQGKCVCRFIIALVHEESAQSDSVQGSGKLGQTCPPGVTGSDASLDVLRS